MNPEEIEQAAKTHGSSTYGQYLKNLISNI